MQSCQIQTILLHHRTYRLVVLIALATMTAIYIIESNWSISSGLLPVPWDHEQAETDNSSETVQTACKFPKLMVFDPLIRPYLKKYDPIQCSKEKNWVYTTGDGNFYIDQDAVDRHGDIRCEYIRLTRITDEEFEKVPLGVFMNGTELDGFTFIAECRAADNATYDNVHASVPNPPDAGLRCRIKETREALAKRKLDVNVVVFLMDSMSHMSYLRNVPNFTNFLIEKMEAHVMNGFNILGDGTQWAELPMLTGQFPTELPEARKKIADAATCDVWPLLFKNFSAAGYITSYQEEPDPVFNYFYKGFRKPPTDYYFNPMMLAVRKRRKKLDYCLGDSTYVGTYFKFWREIQTVYRSLGGRHFSWFFQSDLSHDTNEPVKMLDEDLTILFEQMYSQNYFNDTFLIVMGDHGVRFGDIRQTQPGKLEERLPFLALIPPPWFRHRFPKSERNLRINQNRLVTAFDLHETLKQLLDFGIEDGGKGTLDKRGISLFKEVPANRTCEDAEIKPHFCSCMEWTAASENDTTVREAAQYVIDYFNIETKQAPGKCAELKLHKIISASVLKPNDDVLAFKKSKDFDARVPDLSAKKTLATMVYQVRFVTTPGEGDFEASMTYYLKDNTFTMSPTDVSRTNWYSDQAGCVLGNDLKYLRMFCYCNK